MVGVGCNIAYIGLGIGRICCVVSKFNPNIRWISTTLSCSKFQNNVPDQRDRGNKLIWEDYKRNFKGSIPPQKTRLRCKRRVKKVTRNPCPICRDDIQITHTNVELLKQFVSPYTDAILPATTTGLCRQQQKLMVEAVNKARNYGYMTYTIPTKVHKEVDPKFVRIPPWNRLDITK